MHAKGADSSALSEQWGVLHLLHVRPVLTRALPCPAQLHWKYVKMSADRNPATAVWQTGFDNVVTMDNKHPMTTCDVLEVCFRVPDSIILTQYAVRAHLRRPVRSLVYATIGPKQPLPFIIPTGPRERAVVPPPPRVRAGGPRVQRWPQRRCRGGCSWHQARTQCRIWILLPQLSLLCICGRRRQLILACERVLGSDLWI